MREMIDDPLTFLHKACVLLKGYESITVQLFNATVLYNINERTMKKFNTLYKKIRAEFPKLYPLYGSKETHEMLYGELLKYIQSHLEKRMLKYRADFMSFEEVLELSYLGVNNENWQFTQLRLEDAVKIDKDDDNISFNMDICKNHNFNKYNIETVLRKIFK